jgi:DNA-binding XRE family transcriptional regulator
MLTMVDTKLKQLRLEMNYTQEDFAIAASLRAKTYRNAERGLNTSYTTAQAILRTLNMLRANRGQPLLTLEDLDLKIV